MQLKTLREVERCQIDEQVGVFPMLASNLVLEQKVESGGRKEAMLVRREPKKASGSCLIQC